MIVSIQMWLVKKIPSKLIVVANALESIKLIGIMNLVFSYSVSPLMIQIFQKCVYLSYDLNRCSFLC